NVDVTSQRAARGASRREMAALSSNVAATLVNYALGALVANSSGCGACSDIRLSAGGVENLSSGSLTPVQVPAGLPLFPTGLGSLGLLGWRRKRKARSVAV